MGFSFGEEHIGAAPDLPPVNTRVVARVISCTYRDTKKNDEPCHPYLNIFVRFPDYGMSEGRARVQVPDDANEHVETHRVILSSVITGFRIPASTVGACAAAAKKTSDPSRAFMEALGASIKGCLATCKIRHDEFNGITRAECGFWEPLSDEERRRFAKEWRDPAPMKIGAASEVAGQTYDKPPPSSGGGFRNSQRPAGTFKKQAGGGFRRT